MLKLYRELIGRLRLKQTLDVRDRFQRPYIGGKAIVYDVDLKGKLEVLAEGKRRHCQRSVVNACIFVVGRRYADFLGNCVERHDFDVRRCQRVGESALGELIEAESLLD